MMLPALLIALLAITASASPFGLPSSNKGEPTAEEFDVPVLIKLDCYQGNHNAESTGEGEKVVEQESEIISSCSMRPNKKKYTLEQRREKFKSHKFSFDSSAKNEMSAGSKTQITEKTKKWPSTTQKTVPSPVDVADCSRGNHNVKLPGEGERLLKQERGTISTPRKHRKKEKYTLEQRREKFKSYKFSFESTGKSEIKFGSNTNKEKTSKWPSSTRKLILSPQKGSLPTNELNELLEKQDAFNEYQIDDSKKYKNFGIETTSQTSDEILNEKDGEIEDDEMGLDNGKYVDAKDEVFEEFLRDWVTIKTTQESE